METTFVFEKNGNKFVSTGFRPDDVFSKLLLGFSLVGISSEDETILPWSFDLRVWNRNIGKLSRVSWSGLANIMASTGAVVVGCSRLVADVKIDILCMSLGWCWENAQDGDGYLGYVKINGGKIGFTSSGWYEFEPCKLENFDLIRKIMNLLREEV